MNDHRLVAVPFRVAVAFLLLLFLWSFLGEQFAMIEDPSEYDYEMLEKKRHNHTKIKASRGSFLPWRRHVRDRHQHKDPESLIGHLVILHDLVDRTDLNGAVGRVVAFDTYSAHYTVRLSHHRRGIAKTTGGINIQPKGRKSYRLRSQNLRLFKRMGDSQTLGNIVNSTSVSRDSRNYLRDKLAAEAETATATADIKVSRGVFRTFAVDRIFGFIALFIAVAYGANRIIKVILEISNTSNESVGERIIPMSQAGLYDFYSNAAALPYLAALPHRGADMGQRSTSQPAGTVFDAPVQIPLPSRQNWSQNIHHQVPPLGP